MAHNRKKHEHEPDNLHRLTTAEALVVARILSRAAARKRAAANDHKINKDEHRTAC